MSHESGDHIGVRKGVGEILGISLSLGRSLAINVGVSISSVRIALGGEVSSGGGGVVGVKGGYGAVSVVHKIGISLGLGGPLSIDIGVSIVIGIGLGGEVSGGGGSIGGVIRGHSTIRVVDKLTGGHGH